jgi:hypothetical protein
MTGTYPADSDPGPQDQTSVLRGETAPVINAAVDSTVPVIKADPEIIMRVIEHSEPSTDLLEF